MSEHQRFAASPKWVGQGLTALALTLALATYFHATRSAVATSPNHGETVDFVSTAGRSL